MKSIEELEAEIAAFRKEIVKINKKSQKLDEERKVFSDKIETAFNEITKIKSKQKEVDWDYVLRVNLGMDHHRFQERQLNSIGLKSSGYYQGTNQAAVQIMMYKGDKDNLEQTISGLELILPFIKPITENKKSSKRISIFEYTCSEYGIYAMSIDDEGFHLKKTTYGRTEKLKTFESLRSLLICIQNEHWYENSEKSKYDDEE